MTPTLELAIIDTNTLLCLGLKNLLEQLVPHAIIRVFDSFGAFVDDTPDMYQHYFISSQTYILYNSFFLPRKAKTIILMNGISNNPSPVSNHLLNIFLPQAQLTNELLRQLNPTDETRLSVASEEELTPREIEVLILLTKGLINKEIAQKLSISLHTVISHRKNITEKLGIKSLSGLTIYAVMNGYVSPDTI